MKVKHNFSKDATALLLGCLCLLGTSLQAQIGGDGLEQAKPPFSFHPFGRLESQRIEVSAEPHGDKIRVTGELISISREWYSPTSSKINRLVYREMETSSTGFGVSDIVSIIKNWDPSSPKNSYDDNFQPILRESWSIIINLYRDGDGTYRQEVMPGPGNSTRKRLLMRRRFRGIPEMPHYVGWVSDASAATTTIQTPEGPIKHPHITQSTSTSTRSVEVFNDSGQPIRLALTLPYTDRYVPWFTGQYEPAQWVPQQGVWSSQPLTIPVEASTTLDMALPLGWRAGKFLPESITILSGGGAGGGPGLPGM